MDWMPQAVRDGIVVVLVISGPLVLAAAFIGLAIGILQAATQVQEQTIGSALKIIGVFTLIIITGFWMYQYLSHYAFRTMSGAFTFIPRQTQKAVPIDAFDDEKFNATFVEEVGKVEVPKVLEAEKLEPETLEQALPPHGVPHLGVPEVPKLPKVTKVEPPRLPEIPKVPIEAKPLEELKTVSPITPPTITTPTNTEEKQPTTTKVQEKEGEILLEETPGETQKEEVQEGVKPEQDKTDEQAGGENLDSWLE